ncbi:MAG: hypothetical protein ACRD2G_13175 [Terriglobia bacterium]
MGRAPQGGLFPGGNFLKLANIFLGRTLFAAPGVMREEISGIDNATHHA